MKRETCSPQSRKANVLLNINSFIVRLQRTSQRSFFPNKTNITFILPVTFSMHP